MVEPLDDHDPLRRIGVEQSLGRVQAGNAGTYDDDIGFLDGCFV